MLSRPGESCGAEGKAEPSPPGAAPTPPPAGAGLGTPGERGNAPTGPGRALLPPHSPARGRVRPIPSQPNPRGPPLLSPPTLRARTAPSTLSSPPPPAGAVPSGHREEGRGDRARYLAKSSRSSSAARSRSRVLLRSPPPPVAVVAAAAAITIAGRGPEGEPPPAGGGARPRRAAGSAPGRRKRELLSRPAGARMRRAGRQPGGRFLPRRAPGAGRGGGVTVAVRRAGAGEGRTGRRRGLGGWVVLVAASGGGCEGKGGHICLGEAGRVFVKALCGSWVVTEGSALVAFPVPGFPRKSF